MSDEKLYQIIVQTIENEDNYKRNIKSLLQGVSKAQRIVERNQTINKNRNYVDAILKITSEVIKTNESQIKHKFLALQVTFLLMPLINNFIACKRKHGNKSTSLWVFID